MTQKKLEKGSVWEKADTNGDGTITDNEIALRERMIRLENQDKKEETTNTTIISDPSIGVGGTSPTTTMGPVEKALTKKSSFLINNRIDDSMEYEVESKSEVEISNNDIVMKFGLTCTIGCDAEEKESNEKNTICYGAYQ